MTQGSEIDSKAWLRRFWARLLVGSVAFVLGLGAAASSLRAVANVYAPPGGEKITYLLEHADEIDVIVMGSSIINVGFRAKQFEKRMREDHGRPLGAYSFAMGRLVGAELDFYVRRILELPLPKLKWLLIDVSLDQKPSMQEKNWYSRRELEWQTPRQFSMVWSQFMAREEPLRSRLGKIWPYGRHLAMNVLAIGRALPALEGFDRRNQPTDFSLASSEDERVAIKEAKAAQYRARPAEHWAAAQRLRTKRRPGRDRTNALAAAWRDAAKERGVEVAFILGPTMKNAAFPAKVEGGADLRIFDYNDPSANRRLYQLEYHYDPWHLTEAGAKIFTRALADDLDAAMDALEQR